MSFSSGTFSLVAGNPVVTGTTISSTVQNNTMNDIATGLTTCLLKDGTQTATADVPFLLGLKSTIGIGIGGSASGLGGIAFPATAVAVADANTLDDYEEYTAASAACTGAVTATVVWKATKVGNVVTLTLPVTLSNGVATASFVYGTVIPSGWRPAANVRFLSAPIRDNAADVNQPGLIHITAATGAITVSKDMIATAFTVTAQAGIAEATAVSWTI